MNERIKQLMDQAGIDVEAVENLGEMPTAIKFAELIVRECAQVAADFVPGYGLEPFSKRFKEHYGVEE